MLNNNEIYIEGQDMKNNPTKITFTLLIAAIFVLLSFSVNSAERQIIVAASGGILQQYKRH